MIHSFTYIYAIAMSAIVITMAYGLLNRYGLLYLSNFLYFVIFFNLLAILKLIATYITPQIFGETINKTIQNVELLINYLILPVVPICIFFFTKFVIEFFGDRFSQTLKIGHIIYWSIVTILFPFGMTLYINNNDVRFFKLVLIMYVIGIMVFLLFTVIKILIYLKRSNDIDKKKGMKNLTAIYIVDFIVYIFIFKYFSSPFSGSLIEYFSLFLINLPPIIYLNIFLKKYHTKHPLTFFDESICESIFKKFKITAREREIIQMIVAGKNNQEIESKLFLAKSTIKNHIFNIYQKFGINSRIQLFNILLIHGDQKNVK